VSFSNFRLNWRRLLDNGKYNMRRFTTFGGVPYTVISASTLQPASYTLFQCYGCYGQIADHSYEALPHALLEEGASVVVCHVRGGGELGRAWYHAGLGDKKGQAVDDTLSVIEHCYTQGLAKPSTSFMQAYSAGCVVAAAAYHKSHQPLKGLILHMPFLDLQYAMQDTSLALTSEELEEWGDYSALCPVTNSNSRANVCLTVGGADLRSPPWHTANYLSTMSDTSSIWLNFLEDTDHNVENDSEFQQQFIVSTCWSVSSWIKRAWNVRRTEKLQPRINPGDFP